MILNYLDGTVQTTNTYTILNNLDTDIVPKDDLTYDLGAIDKKFADLFIGNSSIWMGDDNKLSMSNGKVKIRKVKSGFIPTIITNHSNYDINSLFTIAGTTNINDVKTKDFFKYAKTLTGLENIKMNQLFTDNDNEYEEQNAIDSWLIKDTSNIILTNYSNIGLGTDNPLEKLHIVGNTIIDGNLTIDGDIIPSVTSNINIGNTDKTIKELFVNDILLDEGDIIKRSRYSVDISTSNITSNIINTEENYIVFNLNQDDLDTNGNGTTTYTLDFTNISIGKVLINDFLGSEYNIVLTSPITIDVGTSSSKIITNNNTYNTVGGLSNIESDITGSNIIYTSPIVIIRYYNWGYNTESYFNRNYYSLWNRPYIPTKEIDFYNQEYINDYSIKRVFKNIYYENFYDAKMPTDTIDSLTENLNNELILNNLDANDYFQVISLRYTKDNINSTISDSTTIETGPHFISEDDTPYSTNKYIAFRGKDGAKYRFFITHDISNLIKMTDTITISYIVGSGSVNNGIEDYGNGGDKPINGALRIQILNSSNDIIFNEIIWNSSSGYNANWQLYTISIDNTTRQNGIKLKIVHVYNPSTNENWNQTFGIRYIGLNLLNEYKNYINLENIPTSYPTSNNILWTDNYGNLKIDNYQYSQNYNTLENIPFDITSNYIYTNLNKNIGIGTTTPQETLQVNGNVFINSNLTIGSNIYFSGDLYKNGQLYTSYTDSDTSNYLLNNLNTSIIPKDSLTYDLGSVENRFRDLYIGTNSIWFGDSHKISVSGDKIKMKKIKTDVVPQGLVNKLNSTADVIKEETIGVQDVFGCGDNRGGQLGLGDQSDRNLLNKIDYFNDNNITINDISNRWHTLFLDDSGNVYGSGLNSYGRLGLGNTISSTNIPTLITDFIDDQETIITPTPKISKISCGHDHSLFLDEDGKVYSCGYNNYGQLGIGNTTTQYNPVLITSINNIQDIAAGEYYSLFLTNSGQVYSCGFNPWGQLGIGTTTNTEVPTLIDNDILGNAMPVITKIKINYNTSLFLDNLGTVYSCGYNYHGQLGVGNTTNKNRPTKIENFQDQDSGSLSKPTIIDISVGKYHLLLLDNNGQVYSCGTNVYGVLGFSADNFSTTINVLGNNFKLVKIPTLITDFIDDQETNITPTPKISKISCGHEHSLFLDVYGKAYSCGSDQYGQLCHDHHELYGTTKYHIYKPTLITKIDNGDGTVSDIPNNITHISASYYSTFIKEKKVFTLKDWLDYAKSKDSSITNINDIFTDEDAGDENLDIWLANSSNIYLNTSNYNRLGIGITNPEETLHVEGNAIISSNLTVGSNIYISGDLFKNGQLYTSYTDEDTSNYLLNNLNTSIIPKDSLTYDLGSVNNKFAELFVVNANIDGTLTASNLNIIGDTTKINTNIYESENLLILNEQTDGPSLQILHNNNLHYIINTSNLLNNKKFVVDYNGNVGINTDPDVELHVNGNIKFSGSINNVTSQSLDYIKNLDENIITKISQTSNLLDNKSSNFTISIYNELNNKIDNIEVIDNTIVFDGSQVITGFVNANLIPIDNSTIYIDNGLLKANPNNGNTELNTFIAKYEKTEEYIENILAVSNSVTTVDNRIFYENTTLTSNITITNNAPKFFSSYSIYPKDIYIRDVNYNSTINQWTDASYQIITNSSDGIFNNDYNTYGSHKVFSHNLTEFYKSNNVFDSNGDYIGVNNFKGITGLSISIDIGRSIYLRALKLLPNSSTYNTAMPNNFKIYASNDSNSWGNNSHSSWNLIYNNINLLQYKQNEFTLFGNFNNLQTKYRYFTLVVNNINGNNTYLELNELSIIGVQDITNQPIQIDNEINTYVIKLEYNEETKQEYNILPPYLDTDLYAHYTFENNFNDSKNSYNLINNNNCVINYNKNIYDNCALYLDSDIGANIEFPDNINLYNIWNNGNGLTISLWFNMLETTDTYGTILEFAYQTVKYNIDESDYRLSIMKNLNNNSSIQIYWKNFDSNKNVTIQLENSYDNWNHLSFSVDKFGLWYVYLNGKLQTIDISYFQPPNITYNVKVIGRSSFSISHNFNGYIDDLRFYSKVLDHKEVKILYESIYQTIYTSIFTNIIFADILLVAGGGSGGGSTGGGGGSGGILYTQKNYIPINNYIFRIGKGGTSVLSNASDNNLDGGIDGINTVAMDTIVFGGGGGGGGKNGTGNPGGSGGGGAYETAFGGSIMTPLYGSVIINGDYYGNVGVTTKNTQISGDGGAGIFNYTINSVSEYYGGGGKGKDSILDTNSTYDNSTTLGGGGGGGGWLSNTYSGSGGNGIVIIKYYLDKNETEEYSIKTNDDYKVLSGDKVLLNSTLIRRVYNTNEKYFTVYNVEETDIEINIEDIKTFVKLNNVLKFNIINDIAEHVVYYSNSENYTKIVIPRNDVYKININAVFNLEFSSEFCKFYIKLERLGHQPRYLRVFYLPPISEYSSNDSFTLDVSADLELLVNDIITFESNYKLSIYKDSFLTITSTNKTIINGTLIQNIYNNSANEAFTFQSPLNKLGNTITLDQSQLTFNINFTQPLIYNNNDVSIQTNYFANYSHTHNASDIVSGVFNNSLLPIATNSDIGCIKVDNSTILIDSYGTISATPHYTDTNFDLRYDIRRSEGLQITGTANNINTIVSANIGVYDSIYSYIDLRTSSNNGGWIDFGSTAGEDFKVRIRGYNVPRQIEFYTSDNADMTLNENGDLFVSGNITAYYSDERLKTITNNIENVLNTLNNIDVFKYKTNELAHSLGINNNKYDEIGLSAQQVNKYYPELVSIAPFDRKYDENIKDTISKSGKNYLTLNYERLVPILLQGIKELNNKNIKLENELSDIKKDIQDIKKLINK